MICRMHNISNERAFDLLSEGKPLTKVFIDGELFLKIATDEVWHHEVIFEDCIIENFSAIGVRFEKQVKFINCNFKKCELSFTYFLGGLTVDKCIFDNYLDFQAGGHNKKGNPIIITNNSFKDFVNFFDCWYEYNVIVTKNIFFKGTNLLGKPHNINVTFDIEPVIQGNIGQVDLDNEGDKDY